jgi:hypothetical protein
MKLRALALAACLVLATGAHGAESRYQAIVSVLNAQGEFDRNVIASTRDGVTLAECELRRETWLSEFGEGMESAVASMKAAGKHAAFSVECERME